MDNINMKNNRLGTMYQLAATSLMEKNIMENGVGTMKHYKDEYKTIHPYYMENLEMKHNASGVTYYGDTVIYEISNDYDFLGELYLKIEMSKLHNENFYKNNLIYNLINKIVIRHGNNIIYDVPIQYLYIRQLLDLKKSKRLCHDIMSGSFNIDMSMIDHSKHDQEYYLHIPFWKHGNSKQYFPLLQRNNKNSKLQIVITYNKIPKIINRIDDQTSLSFNSSLLYDVIYISKEEQLLYRTRALKYIIEQIAFDEFNIKNIKEIIQLDFKNPVKELIIIAEKEDKYIELDNIEIFINGKRQNETNNDVVNSRRYYHLTKHLNIPSKYIYTYSFCLLPNDIQPTGTMNFNAIKNNFLKIEYKSANVNINVKLKVFCVSINFYDIDENGFGKLRFY